MNNYYIYVYLDPRKSGHYCYNDICFLYEPIYIGKGKENRYLDHINKLENHYNRLLKRKIKTILKNNHNIKDYIIFFKNNISENDSLNIENKLIKEIGRIDLKTGTLTNMTDGGEGVSGKIVSDETKMKLSLLNSSENHPQFGKQRSEETRDKISKSQSGEKSIHFGKDPWNKGKKGLYHHSKESKIKISNSNKGKKVFFSEEQKNNFFKSHCKLIPKEVHQIRMLIKLGFKNKEISKIYNIDPSEISSIKIGRSWKNI